MTMAKTLPAERARRETLTPSTPVIATRSTNVFEPDSVFESCKMVEPHNVAETDNVLTSTCIIYSQP